MGGAGVEKLRFQSGTALVIAGVLALSAPIIEWAAHPRPGLHPYTLTGLILAPMLALAAGAEHRWGKTRTAFMVTLGAGLAASVAVAATNPDPVPGGLLRPVSAMPLWVAAALVPWPHIIAVLGGVGVAITVGFAWGAPTGDVVAQTASQTVAALLAVAISFGWRRSRLSTREAMRLEGEVERREIERGAIARFVRHAAHELRTPLTPMRVLPVTLAAHADDPELHARSLKQLERQVERLTTIVDRLGTLASVETDIHAPPGDLARQAQKTAQRHAGIEYEGPANAPTKASDVAIHTILSELVENAQQSAAGRIRLTARQAGGVWTLDVEDDGPGLPDSAMDRLMEPFGRVALEHHPHERAGIGLALVDAIVAAAGGHLELARSPLGGLRVTVSLPAGRGAGRDPE